MCRRSWIVFSIFPGDAAFIFVPFGDVVGYSHSRGAPTLKKKQKRQQMPGPRWWQCYSWGWRGGAALAL